MPGLGDGKKGIEVFAINVLGPNGEIVNGNGGNFQTSKVCICTCMDIESRQANTTSTRPTRGYGEFDRVLHVP
jgi:hypothetical protein